MEPEEAKDTPATITPARPVNPDAGVAETAAGKAKGGRKQQAQNFNAEEHKYIFRIMATIPGCYSAPEKGEVMTEFMRKLAEGSPAFSRSQEALHSHITKMKSSARSGIRNLTLKPEGERMAAPEYTDDFLTNPGNQAYFNAFSA